MEKEGMKIKDIEKMELLSGHSSGARFSSIFFMSLPLFFMMLAGFAFGFNINLVGIIIFIFILMLWLLKYKYFYYDLFWDKNKLVLLRPFPFQDRKVISNDFEIAPVEILSFVFKLYLLKDKGNKYLIMIVTENILDMFDSDKVSKEMERKFKSYSQEKLSKMDAQ